MQTDYSISIKINLSLLNERKIDINKFIVSIYDDIFIVLNRVPNIDKDEMRSKFIEHLLDNQEFLKFDNENKFCAYLVKFAKNIHMSEMREQNRNIEFDPERFDISSTSVAPAPEPSIKMYIADTGLTITELAKFFGVTRQIIYNYIEVNSVPYNIKRKLLKYKGFHDPKKKIQEIKEIIINEFGSLKYDVFKTIGVDRASFFNACRKGISYSQYLKFSEKLNLYFRSAKTAKESIIENIQENL